jgi:iron-sulfur cluster repair protein YtfE (RIC family)
MSAELPSALPDELRLLLRRHPRETWAGHANLGQLARFWLQRHAMFRELDGMIREGTAAALERQVDEAGFSPWLRQHVGFAVWQLEEHHQVEDHHYFPVFRQAEPRLLAGFEVLERDHDALHGALEELVARANAVLRDEAGEGAAWRSDLGRFHDAQLSLGRELRRHLDDEEDLVIPLILERGERPLLGGM